MNDKTQRNRAAWHTPTVAFDIVTPGGDIVGMSLRGEPIQIPDGSEIRGAKFTLVPLELDAGEGANLTPDAEGEPPANG